MKKSLKIFILTIIAILILLLTIYVIDIYRFNNNKKPLITLKIVHSDYDDGSVTEYYSLGYKFIEYDREWLHSYEKDFFFGKLKNNNTEEFEIKVNIYNPCLNDLNFYVKSNRSYYLKCIDKIMINFKNGVNKELKDAFQNEMINLNEIIKKANSKMLYYDGDAILYKFNDFNILTCTNLNKVIFGDTTLSETYCLEEEFYLTGKVTKVENQTITLKLDMAYSNLGDIITFTSINTYPLGTKLKIFYKGPILELYPSIVNNITKIEVIE